VWIIDPYDDVPPYPSVGLVNSVFAVAAIGAVIASVAVLAHVTDHWAADKPTIDARRGDCLTWPAGSPERATQVDCADQHLFEVVDSQPVDPGSNPSDTAVQARFQQICTRAVADSLGSRYDPGGRFVVGLVWTSVPNQQGARLMCGLQLPSDGSASVAFRGRAVDQDQSSVWTPGTCLGLRNGQPTGVVVDCAGPHGLEITGTVDLSVLFDKGAPTVAAQDAVVPNVCGSATASYLSPVVMAATGLSLHYQPIEPAGWAAGSRRVACRIGSVKPDGSWATLQGSAKTGVLIDGRPGAALPIPNEPPLADLAEKVVVDQPARVTPPTVSPHTAMTAPAPHLADSGSPGPVGDTEGAEPVPDAGQPPPAG
jgi:predicted heme/steroid binding protein